MQPITLDDPVVAEDLGYTEILRGNTEEGVRLLEQAIASEREDAEDADEERIADVQEVLDTVRDATPRGGTGTPRGVADRHDHGPPARTVRPIPDNAGNGTLGSRA